MTPRSTTRYGSMTNVPLTIAMAPIKPRRQPVMQVEHPTSYVKRWERHEKSLARRLAATAHFGAQPAVLVVCRVTLTLFGASSARCGARFDGRPDETSIRLGLADQDTFCARADVSTIEVEPYAAHQ